MVARSLYDPSLCKSSDIVWLLRFVGLSHDTVVLVNTDSEALEICRIIDGPDGGAPSLCTIVQLGLPPLASGARIHCYSHCMRETVPAYSDAPSLVIEGRPPRRPQFHKSPDEGLVVFVVGVEAPTTYPGLFTFVNHLHSLMSHATSRVTFIPWENWGPRATACFELDVRPKISALIGHRFATLSCGALFIFDFNTTRILDAIRRIGDSSARSMDVTMVKHRSDIPKGLLFKKDVVGLLPYMSAIRPASKDWKCLANYEEGLAALSHGTHLFVATCSPFSSRALT